MALNEWRMYKMRILFVVTVAIVCSATASAALAPELAALQREELKHAIHPGNPEKGVPFWNVHAPRFIYPPAFDFKPFEKAENYRFRIYDANGQMHVFTAAEPWASLAPVWEKLPCGQGTVICEAMGCKGGLALFLSGVKVFWKSQAYDGQGPARKRSYREAAVKGYEYVLSFSPVRKFFETGKPDCAWFGFGYPSKTYAALVQGMARYMKLKPEDKTRALRLAELSVAKLRKETFPEPCPLAGWPRTYTTSDGQFCTMPNLVDKVMLIYPCDVGAALLELYSVTGDKSCLADAERIAAVYLKSRRSDGTWPLVIDGKTGEAYGPNALVPDTLMLFFRDLKKVTGKTEYARMEDECLKYLDGHTFKDWYWEGQFEDVIQRPKYENMTGNAPRYMAMYLLERFPGDPTRLAQARDMVRFSEDQFVLWGLMYNEKDGTQPQGVRGGMGRWQENLPAVCEQYDCYCPVNGSAASAIISWLAIGKATGNALDIAKAKSMADKMTAVQLDNGCIPTWWRFGDELAEWVNCQIYSANALFAIADAIGE